MRSHGQQATAAAPGRRHSPPTTCAAPANPLPAVRTARFVTRKQWMVCGADDLNIRVYNYNTMDKVKQFEAHTDYIRCGRGGALPCPFAPAATGMRAEMAAEGPASSESRAARAARGLPAPAPDAEGARRLRVRPAGCLCRHVAVHPTLPYLLSCSDDMLIKLWDWDKARASWQHSWPHSSQLA